MDDKSDGIRKFSWPPGYNYVDRLNYCLHLERLTGDEIVGGTLKKWIYEADVWLERNSNLEDSLSTIKSIILSDRSAEDKLQAIAGVLDND